MTPWLLFSLQNAGTCGSVDNSMDFISPGQYITRLRANSVSVEPELSYNRHPVNSTIPAVIKWDKGGTSVAISGTFNKWDKKLPLVKRWVIIPYTISMQPLH